MTRKKFVKLLMAAGMDRNMANDLAYISRADGMTYAQALERYLPEAVMMKAIRDFGAAVARMAYTIGEYLAEAVKRISVAFNELPPCFLRESTAASVAALEELLEQGGAENEPGPDAGH